MQRERIADALDRAIATVAKSEYHRLSENKNDQKCLACVRGALESLKGLGKGRAPDYNEWDALFYLTWYQPRQINFALAIVRDFWSDHPLHVIDVGCGAFAVQVAMAIAVAEKQLQPDEIHVTVQGIDSSEPMRRIGQKFWQEFQSIVNENQRLSYLADACNVMTTCVPYHSTTSYLSDNAHIRCTDPSVECWLMAMHATYKSNETELAGSLADIRSEFAPALEIVTSSSKMRDVVKSVVGEGFEEKKPEKLRLLWSDGHLPEITEWRRSLLGRLPLQGQADDMVPRFLCNEVEWNPPQNYNVILFRKRS